MSASDAELRELPAWSLAGDAVPRGHEVAWPCPVTREWAWGGSQGEGARVCILDSGMEVEHPLVTPVERAVAVVAGAAGDLEVVEDTEGDAAGHGTACAGIVRSLAPECTISSVRVLGLDVKGRGAVLLAGLRWAVEEGFDVVSLSLSTRAPALLPRLHELADRAYFRRTAIVAAAHNLPVESYPWRFASVISVGSHEQEDPTCFYANRQPPVEFFARGVNIEVAWPGGGTMRVTGNSFATPHMAGLCALILGKHSELTVFQLKSVLALTASNASAG